MAGSQFPTRLGPLFFALVVAAMGCEGPSPEIPFDAAEHISEIESFQEARVAELEAPDSGLVLMAMHWLSEVPSPAYLEFWIDGERHTLDVTGQPHSERSMMVFADQTSGETTYGGERYLWIDAPNERGRVVLDFNGADNPPCVWTPFPTCPLPTRNNRPTVPSEAGEMDWAR